MCVVVVVLQRVDLVMVVWMTVMSTMGFATTLCVVLAADKQLVIFGLSKTVLRKCENTFQVRFVR